MVRVQNSNNNIQDNSQSHDPYYVHPENSRIVCVLLPLSSENYHAWVLKVRHISYNEEQV